MALLSENIIGKKISELLCSTRSGPLPKDTEDTDELNI